MRFVIRHTILMLLCESVPCFENIIRLKAVMWTAVSPDIGMTY
jgi:hypothetical protein